MHTPHDQSMRSRAEYKYPGFLLSSSFYQLSFLSTNKPTTTTNNNNHNETSPHPPPRHHHPGFPPNHPRRGRNQTIPPQNLLPNQRRPHQPLRLGLPHRRRSQRRSPHQGRRECRVCRVEWNQDAVQARWIGLGVPDAGRY